MTTAMRILLIAGSVLTALYVLVRIRRNKMQTENSLFWIFFSLVLVILGFSRRWPTGSRGSWALSPR